jgi:hypothetical protein
MTAKTKLDLKKKYVDLYRPSRKAFEIVDVPPLNFLMVDGAGDPNTAKSYQEALETLYAVAYTLKFMSKADPGIDFTVMPLEGLWWADDMDAFSSDMSDKDRWLWTAMILQPDHISSEMVAQSVEQVRTKKNPTGLDRLRFAEYEEGLSVQILYLGAYADEGPTIAAMHQHAIDQGYRLRGKHHEIYLGDPRRTAPEKLKTVIRQPIEAA